MNLSGSYRKTFNHQLPDASQVADPFHVIKLANTRLDDMRRQVQHENQQRSGGGPTPGR